MHCSPLSFLLDVKCSRTNLANFSCQMEAFTHTSINVLGGVSPFESACHVNSFFGTLDAEFFVASWALCIIFLGWVCIIYPPMASSAICSRLLTSWRFLILHFVALLTFKALWKDIQILSSIQECTIGLKVQCDLTVLPIFEFLFLNSAPVMLGCVLLNIHK